MSAHDSCMTVAFEPVRCRRRADDQDKDEYAEDDGDRGIVDSAMRDVE